MAAINAGALVGTSLKTTSGTWQERLFELTGRKRHELKNVCGRRTPYGSRHHSDAMGQAPDVQVPYVQAPDVGDPLAPESCPLIARPE